MPDPREGEKSQLVYHVDEEQLRALVQQEVKAENLRLVRRVAQRGDTEEFYQLEEQAAAEQGKKRAAIYRRMRRLEPPTRGQIIRRRLAGWGLVGVITAFGIQQGIETRAAFEVSKDAVINLGPHVGAALSHVHINLFNLAETFHEAGQAVDSVLSQTVNTAGEVLNHALQTTGAAGADVLTLIAKPWRKPIRRGTLGI